MNGLFIGLGGAGCYAVAEFAQKIKNYGDNLNNEFIYLDTDGSICESYPFIKNSNDFIPLGGSSKKKGHSIENIINDSIERVTNKETNDVVKKKYMRFLQWYDTNIVSNEELSKGAEGIRMMSRAMLFAHYPKIYEEIKQRMPYRNSTGNQQSRKIFLVSGTCGGTGSGCVIDILYMLARISKDLNFNATELPVNLLLVMPQGYINGTKPTSSLFTSYRTNAYAIVNEINALLKDYYGYFDAETDTDADGNILLNYENKYNKAGMRMNDHDCCGDVAQPFHFNVFQNAFLFDSVTPQGYDMTHEQRSENVANFLFALEVGTQANNTLDSNISNHVRPEKYNSGNNEFVNAFAATGMYVAQSWEELTRKYVRDKFLYQMLHDGFVGSNAPLSPEILITDTTSFTKKIEDTIKEKKTEEGTGINDLLTGILGKMGYAAMEGVMQSIRDSTSDKKPNIGKIFAKADSNSMDDVKALAAAVDNLLLTTKQKTFTSCSEWAQKYNLNHALQLTTKLDGICDDLYKDKIKSIKNLKIETYTLYKETKRRKDCIGLFDQYIDYLVYRNLSKEEEGYLDECKHNLDAAIKSIGFEEHLKDGRKISDWESDYVKYLNTLRNDTTRSVWPSLDRLYSWENACLIRGNDVENDYASLVRQAGNGPDMTYNLDEGTLLYNYKHQCFQSIAESNGRWNEYFDMSKGKDAFANDIKVAFETFEKEAEKLGLEISKSSTLKKPFSQINLSGEDQNTIFQTINNFDEVNLAGVYHMDGAPHVEIYVGDFENMAWLQRRLFPAGVANLDKASVQDRTMEDRVFKLYVEFKHSLGEYRYFRDVYKPYFDTFHAQASKNPKTRHHQPFIDKRFFDLGDVNAYFEKIKREEEAKELKKQRDEEVKALNQNLNGHKGTFLKFCAWFLYKTLTDHASMGLLADKKMTPSKYFKLEKPKGSKARNQKNCIIFGMTNQFGLDSYRDKAEYDPSGVEYRVEMERDYRDSEVKTFSECFDLWLRILQCDDMRSYLDDDKLVEAFLDAQTELTIASDSSRSRFLDSLYSKYMHTLDDGNRQVDWEQLFGDFLKVFPVKKQ